jgi:hypothetical protein
MSSVKALVDRGLEVRATIARFKHELDDIEAALSQRGLYADQVPLKDEDREGRRYLARGSELVVPVVFTADKIIGSFRADSAVHQTIRVAAANFLPQFFTLVRTYECTIDDGKKFRAAAADILGDRAPAFITACLARDKHGIPKSDIKVLWSDAEPKEAA